MSELDQAWSLALAEAERRARAAGRTDISEYLSLRSSNDLLRTTATSWLLTMFEQVAGEANRTGGSIQITLDGEYRFKVGAATMVGRRLNLQNGVRTLSIEVGWPRTPRDGFLRGGGLAHCNINHLGMRSASEQLRLTLDAAGVPRWTIFQGSEENAEIHEADIRHHVSILLTDSRNPPKRS